jgi:ornithine decarboxylase
MSKYATVKGQNLSGISFHVGSGCKDVLQYKTAIFQAYSSLLNIRAEGHHANVIDIGGGFTDNFVEAARVIQKEAPEGVTMIAEPGRFFAQKSQDLFVRVIGKKPGTLPGSWRYTLDESLYGQFSCIPYDQAKPKWIRVREKGEERRPNAPCILYGRTCDSVDYIASADAEMLEEGDWLWFPHMGAYTSVTSTEFNGFPKPPTQVLEMHGHQLPDPSEFQEWPTNLKYVSHVEVPKN